MILVIIVRCLEEASDKVYTFEIMLLNDDDALDGGDNDNFYDSDGISMIKSLFKRQCLGNKQRFHSFSSFDEFVKLAKLASLVLKHNDVPRKKTYSFADISKSGDGTLIVNKK